MLGLATRRSSRSAGRIRRIEEVGIAHSSAFVDRDRA
jgi:hypothetical protein